MKFWLDEGEFIYLFQLLKASSALDDYAEIRTVIKEGKVLVNKEIAINQRVKVFPDDIVRYQDNHIIVKKSKPLKPEKTKTFKEEETHIIQHGNMKKWESKPLKDDLDLDNKINECAKKLHEKLLKDKKTICFAESCTGGMIQQVITSFSGSSEYFSGGIVSYSNEAKINLLNVKPQTIKKNGSVSKQCVTEMVQGVQKVFNTDIAGAVTGIAGPTGGTTDKPVGTVHIAVQINENTQNFKFLFTGDRKKVRKKTTLNMFKIILENI